VSTPAERTQLSRAQAYSAIDSERAYQDSKWGGPEHDKYKTTGDFIVYMTEYLRRAQAAYTTETGDLAALHMIRKVAALAVACMEFNGAPQREGFEGWRV